MALCFLTDCNIGLTDLEERNSRTAKTIHVQKAKDCFYSYNELQLTVIMTCSSPIGKEAPLKTPFYFPKSRTVAIHKGEVKEKTQDCQNQSRNAQNPLLKSEKSFLPSINNKTSLFFAFKLGQDEKVKSKLCATCRALLWC